MRTKKIDRLESSKDSGRAELPIALKSLVRSSERTILECTILDDQDDQLLINTCEVDTGWRYYVILGRSRGWCLLPFDCLWQGLDPRCEEK